MRRSRRALSFVCTMAASTRSRKRAVGIGAGCARTDGELLDALSAGLEAEREAKYADWLERYLRHETPSRGVRIPKIRAVVSRWYSLDGSNVAALPAERQRHLASRLVQLPTVEDKLAGTVLMQDALVPSGLMTHEHLRGLEFLFDDGHIHDWNCCDWFCVRVLSQLVKKEPDDAIPVIVSWHTAENVWRARSSLVSLLPLANDAHYYSMIERAAAFVLRREERFAKTAVGWLFSEIAKHDKRFAKEFLHTNIAHFSTEALNKVTKGFTTSEQTPFRNKLKGVG